ncbi:hypothetical protein ABIA33_005642 [Streptacidiphilus sp. MAP12-16]|uniref:hypothetical protein n=1 Tax=Streptacidiphilus sp. MAP12-16 TaxID=3156300 RepID=UPI003515DB5A
MKTSLGARTRVAFASIAAISLALLLATPASAATGTPTTPTELFNADQACSTDASAPLYVAGRGGLVVEGIPGDSDSSVTELSVQYQIWPLSDPTKIATASNQYALAGNESSANLGGGFLTDGQSYAWQARTVDASGAASAWSAPCYVADDDTAPAAAPTVSSVNYPSGQSNQGGAPIKITLDANGTSDVRGFVYSWVGSLPVAGVASIGEHGIPQFQDPYSDPKYFARADALGGSTTVSLVPPQASGFLVLTVASLDRAFNESPTTRFYIQVKFDGPTVTQLSHPKEFGKPTTFEFTPDPGVEAVSPVVSYTVVHLGQNQTTTTVKASAQGTAKLKITLDGIYGDTLQVSSTSADGWVTQANWWTGGEADTTPTVSSDVYAENGTSGGVGVPGTFTFAPKFKGVASYTYTFSDGTTGTVKAKGQGSAHISWTPSQGGWYDLNVYATTESGIQLAAYDYYFTVN